ncbi:MAG: hypothetical protein M1825_004827 [Sarcosagium campestre]|nr:MAG: hypothetical protein M1825_004827 [Sarcosagium campestre]
MSAPSAAQPSVSRGHSTSRRTQAYPNPAGTGLPNRTQSTTSRPASTAVSTPHRSNSQSHSHNRQPSSHQQPPLGNVLPRRDYETSNVAQTAPSRRSSSRDASHAAPPPPSRADSTRSTHRNTSKHRSSRYGPDPAATTATSPPATAVSRTTSAGADHGERNITSSSSSNKRRTTITGQSGQWALGKTIGQGSMGKVKLAKKAETGEQVAVKIVPRQSTEEGQSTKERERQDHSKEIRTAREAAIVSLLDHPYICGMRDVVRTNYHWYMLFEYVNGGQMLDYIISHGRLKEKQARKFGRQIASALDYSHRNSIVHRDLKIENILISKNGDIKIIDFGLSNLFSPRSHLKTFCGSLYFAAPELLQARQYTGPEVDIWSFGIVLYVLVCGKVPFDDQSMPQLHAKIKKGAVDYPQWLSAECKNLISRMLVTDPRQRAGLQEILTHPWMTKGFSAPPENFLPHREVLQLPLDPEVVLGMTGFDFGPPEFITAQLTKVLESEDYQSAVRVAARDQSSQIYGGERKKGFHGFDFYKRRNSASRDTLSRPSTDALQFGVDPVNAYSPLISIYFLVREKQQRQRNETSPGATAIPKIAGEKPLQVPDLPAPEAAHTNESTYEMPGEVATGGRSRPRARTHGEDEVTATMKNTHLGPEVPPAPSTVTSPAEQPPAKKGSAAVGLLRRFSTRRHKESDRERLSKQQPPSVSVQPAGDVSVPQKNFSVRRTRNRDGPPASTLGTGGSQPQHADLLTPPGTAESGSRRAKALARSTSVNSADYRKRQGQGQGQRGASDTGPTISFNEPPATSGSDRSSVEVRRSRASETSPRDPEKSNLGPAIATLRTKSLGHARRESIQARRARREEAKESKVPEETDQDLAISGPSGDVGGMDSAENVRPVYLKGLFSVQTTSPKPVPAIRAEIIRVLRQLGVEFTEMRGGFKCKHTPSIDLNKVVDNDPPSPDRATNMVQSPGHKRRISFGGFMGGGGAAGGGERDEHGDRQRAPHTPKMLSRKQGLDSSPTNSDASDVSISRGTRAIGETTTHVQSELGGSMILSFEIIIVKVPILALHGIQFKRMAGNTWQYKNMAEKILKELRL